MGCEQGPQEGEEELRLRSRGPPHWRARGVLESSKLRLLSSASQPLSLALAPPFLSCLLCNARALPLL